MSNTPPLCRRRTTTLLPQTDGVATVADGVLASVGEAGTDAPGSGSNGSGGQRSLTLLGGAQVTAVPGPVAGEQDEAED